MFIPYNVRSFFQKGKEMNKNPPSSQSSSTKNHQIDQKMTVKIGGKGHFTPKSLEFVMDIALGKALLTWDDSFQNRALKSYQVLMDAIDLGQQIYGVNTGFGEQGSEFFDRAWIQQNQENLLNYHSCGVGGVFSLEQSRVIFCARIFSLAQGYSGIRPQLIERMIYLFNHDAIAQILILGSVGASGDLTPLAALAGFIAGLGEGWLEGELLSSEEIHLRLELEPWIWEGKEVLAIMNGTSVMTGLAALEWIRLWKMVPWIQWITLLGAEALELPEEPFSFFVQAVKHHQGPKDVAEDLLRVSQLNPDPISLSSVRGLSKESEKNPRKKNIQPRYSFRCAPQSLGVLRDTLEVTGRWLFDEFHSANDNPLVDPEEQRIYHGGNFFGGHVSAACDYLRISLAHVAQLIDRQVQLLLDGKENQGLGANLGLPQDNPIAQGIDTHGSRQPPNFGLKALGITTSALAAEIQHGSAPVLVLSRPTESGNQDIVTMGTISARKLGDSLNLLRYLIAHGLVCSAQAWEIRFPGKRKTIDQFNSDSDQDLSGMDLSNLSNSNEVVDWLRMYVPLVKGSKPLQKELEQLVAILIHY